MLPFSLTGIFGMQIAHLVHAIVALLYIAAMVFQSIWARSARKVRSRACGTAPSTRNGPSSTIRSGTSGKSARATSPSTATGRQSSAGRVTAAGPRSRALTCRRETRRAQPSKWDAVLMFDYRSGPNGRPGMQHVERHHSRHTPAQLFDLVVDVEQYPNFVPWVISAKVTRRQDRTMWTELTMGTGFIRKQFTTVAIAG